MKAVNYKMASLKKNLIERYAAAAAAAADDDDDDDGDDDDASQ